MLKLRKKIKNNNTDNFINVPLIISNDFVGHQQEINKFTETETNKHINDVNDGETRRFKSNKDFKLNTYFYNEDNESFVNEFQIKGISYEDSNTLTSKYTNSFFIFDFFDSSKPQEQTKIFTTYFTKLNNGNEKKYSDDETFKNSNVSSYFITEYSQIFYLNVPLWYINQIDDDTFILYVRISFFNANTGKIIVFQNSNYTINSASPDKMFFRMILNKNTKIFNNSTPINVRELINSEEYIEKFNNTFENFNNLKQLFPNGSVFDFETGTYINNNS